MDPHHCFDQETGEEMKLPSCLRSGHKKQQVDLLHILPLVSSCLARELCLSPTVSDCHKADTLKTSQDPKQRKRADGETQQLPEVTL